MIECMNFIKRIERSIKITIETKRGMFEGVCVSEREMGF